MKTEFKILLAIFCGSFILALIDPIYLHYAVRLGFAIAAFIGFRKALQGRTVKVFLTNLTQTTLGRMRLITAIIIFCGTGLFFILFTYIFWMNPADLASGRITTVRLIVIPVGLVFLGLAGYLVKLLKNHPLPVAPPDVTQ